MKFHLDESVPIGLATFLRQHGHECRTAVETRLLGASDQAQLSYAAEQELILVTHDTAFARRHPPLSSASLADPDSALSYLLPAPPRDRLQRSCHVVAAGPIPIGGLNRKMMLRLISSGDERTSAPAWLIGLPAPRYSSAAPESAALARHSTVAASATHSAASGSACDSAP